MPRDRSAGDVVLSCFLATASPAIQAQWIAPSASAPLPLRRVTVLDAGRPTQRVSLHPGGGALDRFAADPEVEYGVVALRVRSDVPLLVLLGHDPRSPVHARLLDAPPWDAPSVAQPIALEPRRSRRDGGRVVDGAWLVARAGEPPRSVYLVVETSRAPFDARRQPPELLAELYDPARPAELRSLARWWASAGVSIDLPSPLERTQRRAAQLLWPSRPLVD